MTDTAQPVTIPARSRARAPLAPGDAEALIAGIDRGVSLPTEWYTDPDLFAAELEGLHRRAWHYVAHVGMLPAAGDVLPLELARVPIVLVRDQGGDVRGFVNICRHRGHLVVLEAGQQKRLACQYHGWTYNLDGSLLGAPRSRGDELFDPADFGLVPIQVRVWGPTIWANLDLGAPSFDEWIEGMPERLADNGLAIDDCEYGFDHVWDIDANWKVFQDNTIECYHCSTSHPELSKALEMRPSLQEMFDGGPYWLWHRIPFREGLKEGLTYRAKEGERAIYYYHWVFPTTYLQYAGKGFDIGSVKVIAPDRIRFHHTCFMPKGTPEEDLETGRRVLPDDATILQDVDICQRVQAGHASGVAPPGRMLADPEWLVRRMNRLVVEMTSGIR